ncbi:hypothetical protein WR25_12581 isoform E [Diploscapter pachys]|uniref:Uncharacterized protein n=1 Tax=Diploscapter pachys TaxID=2018661 RepID=A0A2A2L7K0_9BILA|nr:hypothetical protein WR25_12581 isoform E [Diploscapter pachys]
MNDDFTVRAFDPADLPNDWAGDGMYNRVNALKKTDTNLKTLLSIGGWSFGTRLFQDMASTAANRKTFIDSAIAFVRQWNFDGIDIDWEYPSGPVDKTNFAQLFQELRSAVEFEAGSSGKDRLLVTAAVSAGQATIDAGYDVPNIANSLDFILVMSYDFYGAWSSNTGFNSPLFAEENVPDFEKVWSVSWAANYWSTKGMPKSKIIIGMPTYGRGWTLKDPSNYTVGAPGTPAKVTPFTQEAGVAAFFEFCEMLATGAQRYWDTTSQVPYLVQGDQWFGYDDQESFTNKMTWIKRENYGGAFVWTLDFDDFNAKCSNSDGKIYPLIRIIAKELGGIDIQNVSYNRFAKINGRKFQGPPASTTKSPMTTTQIPPATTARGGMTTPTTTFRPVTPPATTTPKPTDSAQCLNLPNGFHSVEKSCESFALCSKGNYFPMVCPSGFHFSPSRSYCVPVSESDCVVATTIKPG